MALSIGTQRRAVIIKITDALVSLACAAGETHILINDGHELELRPDQYVTIEYRTVGFGARWVIVK